ncbi:MAG: 4-(cytidine 5'-diphospho)-2-C-methyl-D-erythritol kinase [Nitrospirae bacterium GWF2_44_13]|nr:MAG: 4-(cytidine 5'-diphospho)-2-C-methyl-D-erythritol kinase [Nitrospirae bacterium GWF2_44_13]OGW63697.1 MAG: 4-(cytidine 5'-diphospho)-2-C-methyl-D-erythritol kinase [Nitrospirae bacterium RIFOXYA2_FULL_44_9]HBG92915.1 4-(cytidine 5'-diphospho)-2-C-methyl-D-erythritol kinase [Nitrospiraceae bacterium]
MFTLKTPAKINWFLSVLGKREDGYHEILSLMQSISLYDHLTFEHSDRIEIKTDADIPLEENLVYKAAVLLKEKLSVSKGAVITLRKDIPVSAGLGGGSSDAAYALSGLNRLWELGLKDEELIKFGGMLGSDVPFFFKAPIAVVRGRGEIVAGLEVVSRHIIVIVKPALGISSKWAYSEMSKLLPELTKRDNNIKLFCHALERQDFKSIALMMKNDLELPVIREFQVIGEIKDRLLAMGAEASLMSGSGPTVFGVFNSREKAEDAAEAMRPFWSRVVETLI